MESQHVFVCSADVAAFVDALETIGYPVVEAESSDMTVTAIDGEVHPTAYALENSTVVSPDTIQTPAKRFRTNPKQQKEVIEKLFEKQKAVVTEKSFMNIKGNKRFKSDVWRWFGDIKLLISCSEAKKLKIPYYIRYCGEEQMMLSSLFVGCFKCSALFIHDTQKSGTSTLRAHMKVCSRPKSKRKRGSPTVIFFPKQVNNDQVSKETTEDERLSAQEHILNFLLGTDSVFDTVDEVELHNLLQMCVTIGATYGDVNIESMLCPQKKLSDFLLNDLYITAINTFYTEFQYTYGATYNINIWVEQIQKTSYISLTCHYSNTAGELKSVTLHTDEFACVSNSDDAKDWFASIIINQPVVPFKRLIITDNSSNLVSAFRDEQCIRCAVQNMNNVLQDVVKKALQANHNEFLDFSSLVSGCIDLVAYFEQISLQYTLTEPLKGIKDDSWTGVLALFKSVNKQYDEILSILNETGETHLISVDKSVITDVIDFFHTFESSLLELSSSSEPTLNIVIPWITKLKKHCLPSEDDIQIVQFLKKESLVGLNEHLANNVSVYHRIATLLDPRFKRFTFSPREDQIAANVKTKCLVKECMEAPIIEDFPNPHRLQNEPAEKDRFSDLYASSNLTNDATNSEKSAHREVDNYLLEPFQLVNQDLDQRIKYSPLRYWAENSDRYPNLSKVAMWVLSSPASCYKSDETFMDNNWFVSCCRVHQSPEHVNKTLFVKSFKKL